VVESPHGTKPGYQAAPTPAASKVAAGPKASKGWAEMNKQWKKGFGTEVPVVPTDLHYAADGETVKAVTVKFKNKHGKTIFDVVSLAPDGTITGSQNLGLKMKNAIPKALIGTKLKVGALARKKWKADITTSLQVWEVLSEATLELAEPDPDEDHEAEEPADADDDPDFDFEQPDFSFDLPGGGATTTRRLPPSHGTTDHIPIDPGAAVNAEKLGGDQGVPKGKGKTDAA
jgi:hypothetical protein